MKKLITFLMIVFTFPTAAWAEGAVAKSHSLDDAPRTRFELGLGLGEMNVNFEGGYFLNTYSRIGSLGATTVGLSHRFDLTETGSLRLSAKASGTAGMGFDREARSQNRYDLNGMWMWKMASVLTLEGGVGFEYNRLRMAADPGGAIDGVPYGGSNYVRVRPAIAASVQHRYFFLRAELASPIALSGIAVAPESSTDLDWSIVDRDLAYEVVAEIGWRPVEVFEIGLRRTRSSWAVTYDQPAGAVVKSRTS